MQTHASSSFVFLGLMAAISSTGCALEVGSGTESHPAGEATSPITGGSFDGSVHPEVVTMNIGGARCSGVTVSERYILTAAHCVDGALGFPGAFEGPVSLSVQFALDGQTKTTVFSGTARAAVHPSYLLNFISGPCSYPQFDIALIRLSSDATSFRRSRLQMFNALLPSRHEIVGWGSHMDIVPAGTLRFAGIGDVDSWGGNGFIWLESDPAWADPGDSGGGLFVKPSSSSSKRVLTGLVSGGNSDETCGPLISLNLDFVTEQAEDWNRPLSCTTNTLGSVLFLEGCTD